MDLLNLLKLLYVLVVGKLNGLGTLRSVMGKPGGKDRNSIGCERTYLILLLSND